MGKWRFLEINWITDLENVVGRSIDLQEIKKIYINQIEKVFKEVIRYGFQFKQGGEIPFFLSHHSI